MTATLQVQLDPERLGQPSAVGAGIAPAGCGSIGSSRCF